MTVERHMPPDVGTLRFLLILAEEFTSDDGLRQIVPLDEDAEDYWDARLAEKPTAAVPDRSTVFGCPSNQAAGKRDDAAVHHVRVLVVIGRCGLADQGSDAAVV